jgi:hypothetical protein
MSRKVVFGLLVLSATLILFAAYFDAFVASVEKNDCTMMDEIGAFAHVDFEIDSNQSSRSSRHYRLFVLHTDTRSVPCFDCIPILFLPGERVRLQTVAVTRALAGHAGSFRQGITFATQILRRSEHHHARPTFEFYSIDFAEEWSALDGAVAVAKRCQRLR